MLFVFTASSSRYVKTTRLGPETSYTLLRCRENKFARKSLTPAIPRRGDSAAVGGGSDTVEAHTYFPGDRRPPRNLTMRKPARWF